MLLFSFVIIQVWYCTGVVLHECANAQVWYLLGLLNYLRGSDFKRNAQHYLKRGIQVEFFCSDSIRVVKLRYNGLTYNVSLVIAYASSRSPHFSIQNTSVSTYLDITYCRLLRTIFWTKKLQLTPTSTYVRPTSRCLRS